MQIVIILISTIILSIKMEIIVNFVYILKVLSGRKIKLFKNYMFNLKNKKLIIASCQLNSIKWKH